MAPVWLAGFETDIQGISGKGSGTDAKPVGTFAFSGAPGEVVTTSVASSSHLDYLGTVRGRVGYLFTASFLLYGTGGLAYGGVKASTAISTDPTSTVYSSPSRASRAIRRQQGHFRRREWDGRPAPAWNGCSHQSGARRSISPLRLGQRDVCRRFTRDDLRHASCGPWSRRRGVDVHCQILGRYRPCRRELPLVLIRIGVGSIQSAGGSKDRRAESEDRWPTFTDGDAESLPAWRALLPPHRCRLSLAHWCFCQIDCPCTFPYRLCYFCLVTATQSGSLGCRTFGWAVRGRAGLSRG